jgi:hypothetical protein
MVSMSGTFDALLRWLRTKGVQGQKPFHQLRKLFSSAVDEAHAVHARIGVTGFFRSLARDQSRSTPLAALIRAAKAFRKRAPVKLNGFDHCHRIVQQFRKLALSS